MEVKNALEKTMSNNRVQNMLECLTKCKRDYKNEHEDAIKFRNLNVKLENELKQARELEKSHRYHLLNSREMISNLQETVSQLVYLKRDVKRIKDEITLRDSSIALLEKEKDCMLEKHNATVERLHNVHKQEIQELSSNFEKKAQQIQYECDTQVAQFTCVIEELRNKLKDTEAEHREKMNMLVLEYEEKVQRSVAQIAQLQDQLTRQAAHTDVNIEAYRRKLEELEEKLKQYQFKEYLARSKYSTSQYENRVERPYSVDRNTYTNSSSIDYSHTNQSQKDLASPITDIKTQKPTVNRLHVMYQDNKNSAPKTHEKKGQFNITKKRKLYNEKHFLNM